MTTYNLIASSDESTVVVEYTPLIVKVKEYQSEADLAHEFIRLLSEQGYVYLAINNEAALIANLRRQLETLNGIVFSDGEWERFFNESIASQSEGIE